MFILTEEQFQALKSHFVDLWAKSNTTNSGQAVQNAAPDPPKPVQACFVDQKLTAHSHPTSIISQYTPTGKAKGGVAASHTEAGTDLDDAKSNKVKFETIGKKYGIPPELLAGMASRESQFGKSPLVDEFGYGDHGNAYGIMQVDKRYHKIRGSSIDDIDHIDQAAQILKDRINTAKRHYPDWPEARQLQRATALYNGNSAPASTVRDLSVNDGNIDVGTTDGDYSNDVWARAQYFSDNW